MRGCLGRRDGKGNLFHEHREVLREELHEGEAVPRCVLPVWSWGLRGWGGYVCRMRVVVVVGGWFWWVDVVVGVVGRCGEDLHEGEEVPRCREA